MPNRITSGTGLVGRLQLESGAELLDGSGAPVSGTTSATKADPGSLYMNVDNGVLYINEGTNAAPYWSPVSYDQPGLMAWHTDFRDGVGKAVTDTAALLVIPGPGVRVHGQGIAEAADSGLVVAIDDQGAVAALSTTNETAHVAALSEGQTADVPFQPDQNGPLVIDVVASQNAAITDRAFFCGFLGTSADALDPAVTGSSTTLTLVQDDLAGIFMDSGLTDADGFFAPHNKSNEAATILTSATGVDLSTTMAAAGTYQRFRVEIDAAGVMTCFIDKVQVTRITASLDADEEVAATLYVESNAIAIKTMDVKRFAAWGNRV